jgi:hypothetical protein
MLVLRRRTNHMLQTISKVVLLATKVDCLDTKVALVVTCMVAWALLTRATTLDIKVEGQASREAIHLLPKVAANPLIRAAIRHLRSKVATNPLTKVATLAMAGVVHQATQAKQEMQTTNKTAVTTTLVHRAMGRDSTA